MKSKFTHRLSFSILCFLAIYFCFVNNVTAQNPNWVVPGGNFDPSVITFSPLPQSPTSPLGNPVTDPNSAYQGEPSENTFTGYTGFDGELKMFAIDGRMYDKDGFMVNFLRYEQGSDPELGLKGISEMLILPMGNSCERFAVIFPSSLSNSYTLQNANVHMLWGVYNTSMENTYNGWATGAMEGQGSIFDGGNGATLNSLNDDYFDNHHSAGMTLYAQDGQGKSTSTQYSVAATKLIDNCFRYVMVCDGRNLIRYVLDDTGLHYDNYHYEISTSVAQTGQGWRTEMEMIEYEEGKYRLAIGTASGTSNFEPGRAIRFMDFDQNMEVIPSTFNVIDLGQDFFGAMADPYGIEFDATGRYIYFTHKANANFQSNLSVWDVQTNSNVTPAYSNPTGIADFERSFIERFGDDLYLAKGTHIARIQNATALPATVDQNFQAIPSGYGNDAGGGSVSFRYILPDQVDDDQYGNFDEFSCHCCQMYTDQAENAVTVYETASVETWTHDLNPLNGGTGAEVTIREELRIKAGADIDIEGMIFYFKPGARVVIERGDGVEAGAMLTLKNTLFTIDESCADTLFRNCSGSGLDDCEPRMWQGVELQGHPDQEQVFPPISWTGFSKPNFSFTHQGKFFMYEDSQIEFAETGLTVGAQSEQDYGGGIAIILESTFKDNINGIDFQPYVWLNSSGNEMINASRISDSDFLTTDDFMSTLSAFDVLPGALVWLRDVGQVNIRGSRFENTASWSSNVISGMGVRVENAAANISWYCADGPVWPCTNFVRSEFIGLHQGVSGLNTESNRKLQVKAADFEMNLIGVSLSNFINPDILDNSFVIPREADRFGLWMLSSTGYTVEGNTFKHESGSSFPESAGILVSESGESDNYIYRNTFTDMRFGAVSQGVNGDLQLFDPGLRYRCNTFDFPIRTGDIFVFTGNISDEQGDCLDSFGVPQPDLPAGNMFSHTSTAVSNHRDIVVSTSGVFPANLQIVYRHHETPPDRLEPISYTGNNYVQPVLCQGNSYDQANSCPVIKRSGFGAGSGIEQGPKSGEASPPSLEDITAEALIHEDNVAALAAEMDGGQTKEILEMIYQGAPASSISPMLSEAGSSLSNTVLKALAASSNEDYTALAAEAAGLPSWVVEESPDGVLSSADVSVSTNEYESEWKRAREARSNFWNRVVDIYQTDTAGILPPEAMADLLNQYQPKSLERFASNFSQTSSLVSADWVRSYNAADYTDFGGLALPSMTEDGLPYNLPDQFEQGFFSKAGNAAALNAVYIEHDQSYGPHFAGYIEDLGGEDDAKINEDIESGSETLVSAYPNPFTDAVTFKITDRDLSYERLELRIFDVTGRSVWSEVYGADAKTVLIDGREFPQGVLIYTVFADGEFIENGKILRIE